MKSIRKGLSGRQELLPTLTMKKIKFQKLNENIRMFSQKNVIQFGEDNAFIVDKNQLQIHSDQFSYPLLDGEYSATLQFTRDLESGVYDFYHVEVPQVVKGRGVAMPFSKACFDYALENNWKVRVTCTYLRRKFLAEYHSIYKSMLVD